MLTREHWELLLATATDLKHEWAPIWATALFTGMRNGELFALRWNQVNLDERKILVSQNWDSKSGFRDYPKNKNHRIVEFPKRLLNVFADLQISRDDDFVLPRAWGWEQGRQAEVLRACLVGLALPRVRFHDLRASWATYLLSEGVPPAKVMAMGGWSDLKTVMYYLRKAGIEIRGAADPFDSIDKPKNQN